MPLCDRCFNLVPESEIVSVCVTRITWGSPAEYSEICKECLGPPREEDYERAEQSEAWQRRGGGGL
jgi:hypothetical protein